MKPTLGITTKLMTYDELFKVKPVVINRDTEQRIARVAKLIRKQLLPTHLIIHVGKANNNFGKYKKGDLFRLDGNTRFDVFKVFPDLIPQQPFVCLIYDVEDESMMKSIYYSIDSVQSVETSNDKMTGFLRERGYTPKSAVVKKGKFKTAVDIACRYGDDSKGLYLNTQSIEKKVDFLWKEIKFLDNQGLDTMDRYSANIMGAFLMLCKKYGVNHPRISLLINNYKGGITTTNNAKSVDGVHMVYNDVYAQNKQVWKHTGYGNSVPLVAEILYCFDQFVKGKTISKQQKFPTKKSLSEYYQYFMSES